MQHQVIGGKFAAGHHSGLNRFSFAMELLAGAVVVVRAMTSSTGSGKWSVGFNLNFQDQRNCPLRIVRSVTLYATDRGVSALDFHHLVTPMTVSLRSTVALPFFGSGVCASAFPYADFA